MKWVILLLILFVTEKSFSQKNLRSFTLINSNQRDTLIYMNDSTGNYVPISAVNLMLDSSRIIHIVCKKTEPIRRYFLRHGIAILIDPQKVIDNDKKERLLQDTAKKYRRGLWKNKGLVADTIKTENDKMLAKQNISPTNLNPRFITKNLSTKIGTSKRITVKVSIELPEDKYSSDNNSDSGIVVEQRKFLYQYTNKKSQMMYFRRLPINCEDGPIGISTKDLYIDYNLVDTVSVSNSQTIFSKLLYLGQVGFKRPDLLFSKILVEKHANNNDYKLDSINRHNHYYAQNLKRGIWKQWTIKNPHPLIILDYPIYTKDKTICAPKLSLLQKAKIFIVNLWNTYLGKVIAFATVVMTFLLTLKSFRKEVLKLIRLKGINNNGNK